MNTPKPTKISAAPPQFGSTGATSAPKGGAANRHAGDFDIVQRPTREGHRTGHTGATLGRCVHVPTGAVVVRSVSRVSVTAIGGRRHRARERHDDVPLTVPLGGRPAAGVTLIDSVPDSLPDAGVT